VLVLTEKCYAKFYWNFGEVMWQAESCRRRLPDSLSGPGFKSIA